MRKMLSIPAMGERLTSYSHVGLFYLPERQRLLVRASWAVGLDSMVTFDVALDVTDHVHVSCVPPDDDTGLWYPVRFIPSRRMCQVIGSAMLSKTAKFFTQSERRSIYSDICSFSRKKLVDFFRISSRYVAIWKSREITLECARRPVHLLAPDFLYGWNAPSAWSDDLQENAQSGH